MSLEGASALAPLPDEVSALEVSHRHSATKWKTELKSLKRSMTKAGALGAGAPKFPSLLQPEEQARRLGSEWPRTGENRCRICPVCAAHCEFPDGLGLQGEAAFLMHSFRDAEPQPV